MWSDETETMVYPFLFCASKDKCQKSVMEPVREIAQLLTIDVKKP